MYAATYEFLVYVVSINLLILNYQFENDHYHMEFFNPMEAKYFAEFCFMHVCFTMIGTGIIWYPTLLGPF